MAECSGMPGVPSLVETGRHPESIHRNLPTVMMHQGPINSSGVMLLRGRLLKAKQVCSERERESALIDPGETGLTLCQEGDGRASERGRRSADDLVMAALITVLKVGHRQP